MQSLIMAILKSAHLAASRLIRSATNSRGESELLCWWHHHTNTVPLRHDDHAVQG
jgi:hypothetical protein